jgi:hypothetical protein
MKNPIENPIKTMIEQVMSQELNESKEMFNDLLAYKINEKIQDKKLEVAQSIFGTR